MRVYEGQSLLAEYLKTLLSAGLHLFPLLTPLNDCPLLPLMDFNPSFPLEDLFHYLNLLSTCELSQQAIIMHLTSYHNRTIQSKY